MGAPYFNPPHVQKVNTIEAGNYFVPTQGVEEANIKDLSAKQEKTRKILKTIGLVLALAGFAILATVVLYDYFTLGVY